MDDVRGDDSRLKLGRLQAIALWLGGPETTRVSMVRKDGGMHFSFAQAYLSRFARRAGVAILAAAAIGLPARSEAAESRFRAAMNIELQILDPHITTATVTRAFGYMVYDTLISMDTKGVFHPQMLESWNASDDRLTWTMTLRPGLTWHDGAPVTP